MLDTPLTPQHPLILTYYCINILDPSEKFVEVGIIHPIVFHLKVMELFMAVTGVSDNQLRKLSTYIIKHMLYFVLICIYIIYVTL